MKKMIMALVACLFGGMQLHAQDVETVPSIDPDYVSINQDVQFLRTSPLGGIIRLFGSSKTSDIVLNMQLDTADTLVYVRVTPFEPDSQAPVGHVQLVSLVTVSNLWTKLTDDPPVGEAYGEVRLHLPPEYNHRFWIEVFVSNLHEGAFLVTEASSLGADIVSWVKRGLLRAQRITSQTLASIPPYGEAFFKAVKAEPGMEEKYAELQAIHERLRFLVAVKEAPPEPVSTSTSPPPSYLTEDSLQKMLVKWGGLLIAIGIVVAIVVVVVALFARKWFASRRLPEQPVGVSVFISSLSPGERGLPPVQVREEVSSDPVEPAAGEPVRYEIPRNALELLQPILQALQHSQGPPQPEPKKGAARKTPDEALAKFAPRSDKSRGSEY